MIGTNEGNDSGLLVISFIVLLRLTL